MTPRGVLETVLYAEDLAAARGFYEGLLGLECFQQDGDRDVFFRCGAQTLLVFNPERTSIKRPLKPGIPPSHGARGQGHVCFSATSGEISAWRSRFEEQGIAIETDFVWDKGGRSLYVRDPAGNSVEFAEPMIWGLPNEKRSLRGAKIVVATHNRGKAREIGDLLRPYEVEAVAAGELGLPEPEETGRSFAANAILKAEAAARASDLPALSDDSGLCVAALGGEPGIHSARWAGPDKDFARAMRLVEEQLAAKGAREPKDRRAHFVSALSVAWPDGHSEVFEGRVDGSLAWPPRGTRGFGYDPMFVADGETLSFGEMEPRAKHALSHRARAFAALVDDLF